MFVFVTFRLLVTISQSTKKHKQKDINYNESAKCPQHKRIPAQFVVQ